MSYWPYGVRTSAEGLTHCPDCGSELTDWGTAEGYVYMEHWLGCRDNFRVLALKESGRCQRRHPLPAKELEAWYKMYPQSRPKLQMELL